VVVGTVLAEVVVVVPVFAVVPLVPVGVYVVVGVKLEPYWPCVHGCQTTGWRGNCQFSAGAFASAVSMKSFQIVAGNVPP
jgi:hypothetical protein